MSHKSPNPDRSNANTGTRGSCYHPGKHLLESATVDRIITRLKSNNDDMVMLHLKNCICNSDIPLIVMDTVPCEIVRNEIFKYPISASEKYQNEFPTPKYVGMDTLIIIME